MDTLHEESKIKTIGFYNIHKLVKTYKIKHMPKMERILKSLSGSRTHFTPEAIKTSLKISEVVKLIKKLK